MGNVPLETGKLQKMTHRKKSSLDSFQFISSCSPTVL